MTQCPLGAPNNPSSDYSHADPLVSDRKEITEIHDLYLDAVRLPLLLQWTMDGLVN